MKQNKRTCISIAAFRCWSRRNFELFNSLHISSEMDKAWDIKSQLADICKKSGFSYITIDLAGYRTGSINEVLTEPDKKDYQKKPLNNR